MRYISLVLVLIACVQPSFAQTTSVAEITAYKKQVDRFIKQKPKERLFGDVSTDVNDSEGVWREFKSEAARRKASENMYQSASVYSRNGKVVGANFTFTSPSGDWAHLIMYYFREDGSLAKIEAQLNTFYGDISVVRHRYFDSHGTLLKSTQQYLDLQTHKPKKPVEFMDNPIPVYSTVSALPFHKLL